MTDSRFDMQIPTPESLPEPEDVKGKGVAGRPSKRTKFNKYGFLDILLGYIFPYKKILVSQLEYPLNSTISTHLGL